MTTDFDIAICGAGPVGMALAALLVQRGATPHRITLIDGKSIEQAAKDPRSIALSYGSRQILERIDAWPTQLDTIREIHVSRRGHFGRTLIECGEYGLPALGYVSRYGTLVAALTGAIERAGVVSLRPMQIDSYAEAPEQVNVQLNDGGMVSTHVMVQAEGGVFGEQATRTLYRDYRQTAVVAHVTVSAALPYRAFERFTDEGPLALLPQEGGYALVWCMSPGNAERIIALSDADFLAQLQLAFGSRVGQFIRVAQRTAYPLGLNAHPAASARTVAIGNAAQTLHPVAGQGLNLGLRDAAVLARLLAQQATPAMLERFVGIRQADRSMTIQLTDIMARIFTNSAQSSLSQSMLGLLLGVFDVVKPARQALAEHMMFGKR